MIFWCFALTVTVHGLKKAGRECRQHLLAGCRSRPEGQDLGGAVAIQVGILDRSQGNEAQVDRAGDRPASRRVEAEPLGRPRGRDHRRCTTPRTIVAEPRFQAGLLEGVNETDRPGYSTAIGPIVPRRR